MSMIQRTVSPLGSSRFEQPFMPRTPTSPESVVSRYRHAHKPSLSKWSVTDSFGYSTAASSLYQAYEVKEPPVHDLVPVEDHNLEIDVHATVHDNPDWQDEWHTDFDYANDEYLGDECPDGATLAATYHIPVFTADGHAIPFGSIFHPSTAIHQRQLIVFTRHFFCGACQAYVKALTEGITSQDYYAIPIPTSIIIIGCGRPNLIPFYKEVTGTSFPIFADPTRRLYKKLGMVLSLKIGPHRPEYMKDISAPAWLAGQVKTMRNGLKSKEDVHRMSRLSSGFDLVSPSSGLEPGPMLRRSPSLRKRDFVRGGNPFQIGGEMLFEDGEVIWCSRMRHYRDHVEVSDIRRLLGLDEDE